MQSTGVADVLADRSVSAAGAWRPFRGPFARWPHLTDLAIALVSFALTLLLWGRESELNALSLDSFSDVGAFVCAFVGSLALLWRRSHAFQVHLVVLAVSLLVKFGTSAAGIVALPFSLYSLGRYEANSRNSMIGALVALIYIALDLGALSAPSIGATIAAAMVIGLWYVGRRLRFRGEYLRLLEERARHLERERNVESERAVAAERSRIAREMHDVVAHQVSLMTVQAGAARTVNESDPEAAATAMAAVENAGRRALSEMRHLLSVLRPLDAEDALGPQPGMADLPALVQRVGEVGPEVRLETGGRLSGLSARLELNAYRIVQEALTNVVKHADATVVEVSVIARGDSIALTISDNGIGGDGGSGGGHGIVGMRERVELLGGSFHAGPGAEGGFEVRAVLPREPRAA